MVRNMPPTHSAVGVTWISQTPPLGLGPWNCGTKLQSAVGVDDPVMLCRIARFFRYLVPPGHETVWFSPFVPKCPPMYSD